MGIVPNEVRTWKFWTEDDRNQNINQPELLATLFSLKKHLRQTYAWFLLVFFIHNFTVVNKLSGTKKQSKNRHAGYRILVGKYIDFYPKGARNTRFQIFPRIIYRLLLAAIRNPEVDLFDAAWYRQIGRFISLQSKAWATLGHAFKVFKGKIGLSNGFTPQQNWLPSTQRLLNLFFFNIYVSLKKHTSVAKA